MPNVRTVQKGGHVSIRLTARELRDDAADGQRLPINGIRFVRILDPAGDAIASNLLPTWHLEGTGRYVCHLDTSSLAVGDYECEVEVGVAFSSQTNTTERKARTDFLLRLRGHSVP